MIAGLSGKVLPIHPQPKQGEIFSSWYCRVAKANSMKLHTLEVKLWGRDKQIWTRDIDRSIDGPTLEHFAAMCGTPIERARETTLKSYEGIVFRDLNQNGHSSWILPAGMYHRKRLLPTMQFCPYCLLTDADAYYRKYWRLAFSTICERHGCMLHDCCPECGSPVVFHRQELGKRWHWEVESLGFCTRCAFDLRRATPYDAPVAEIHAFLAHQHQLSYFDWGWTFAGDETFQYSHLYFDALRNLLGKLRSTRTVVRLREEAERELSITVDWPSPPNTPFEFYGVMERHCMLQIAIWLLMDWPDRFQRIARAAKIRFSELMRDLNGDAFWFRKGAGVLECNPVGPCPEERQAMRSLLLGAVNDEIRLDFLKRKVVARTSGEAIRELWTAEGLPFPREIADGVRLSLTDRYALAGNMPRILPRDRRDVSTAAVPVVATVSAKRNGTYGLRVCVPSREILEEWFSREWEDVEVEMDGQVQTVKFRAKFWEITRELRSPAIRAWLAKRGMTAWPSGRPPQFELVRLEGRRFRLLG